ncbi:MAG TPA: hypothetical protein DEA05_09010, partial [Rhodobacteraceae bacterium]|nr:hypothetical protein [Paracoccaceae bacterium]
SLFWFRSVATLLGWRRDLVLQAAGTDCGVACALSVLGRLGRRADPVEAIDAMDPERTGTDMESLRAFFADRHGIPARAMAVPADRLPEITGHAILHMTQQHYVVLLARAPQGVLVFDPSMGPVHYPPADFTALYSGYLVEVSRKPPRGEARLPARRPDRVVGGDPGGGLAPASLAVIGVASRLLELALVLCLCAVLYLVLNQAGFASMLLAFGLIAICGGLLLLARQVRFEGEGALVRRRQTRVWSRLLRIVARGRDLSGFRGHPEREVAGAFRRGLTVTIPQPAQLPATLGGFLTVSAALWLLHPAVGAAHLVAFAATIVALQLDGIHQCRRSVRGTVGRYSKLLAGREALWTAVSPDMIGEFAKWGVIGAAGLITLLGQLSDLALMFWILTAMQIVPLDFRRASALAPALGAAAPVSGLVAAEVPLRAQKMVGTPALAPVSRDGLLRIDGLAPMTAGLRQPDLTVREQRLILADVVRNSLRTLPEADRPGIDQIRIFAPGQEASQADVGQVILAREAAASTAVALPWPCRTRSARRAAKRCRTPSSAR